MKLVRLQERGCYAMRKQHCHVPHLYHVLQKAVDSTSDPESFYSYFYCPGFGDSEIPSPDAEPFEPMKAEPEEQA